MPGWSLTVAGIFIGKMRGIHGLIAEETANDRNVWSCATKKYRAYVYVIGSGKGPFKVGRSSRPESRLRALQQATPRKLYLWATRLCPDAHTAEHRAHVLLTGFERRGEWFTCSLADAIRAVEVAASEQD